MQVTARFFAVLRERMGCSTLQVELASNATVSVLWEHLVAGRDDLHGFGFATRCAVNGVYASSDTLLRDGDEVAFLPPVSGG